MSGCDCACHRCCVPPDASCEDCEDSHPTEIEAPEARFASGGLILTGAGSVQVRLADDECVLDPKAGWRCVRCDEVHLRAGHDPRPGRPVTDPDGCSEVLP